MAKRIRKQNKERLAVSLEKLAKNALRGVGALFGFVADLEAQGKDQRIVQGEVAGRTKSGKEIKGWYGLRVKVGLPVRDSDLVGTKPGLKPEEFEGQKKLDGGSGGSK